MYYPEVDWIHATTQFLTVFQHVSTFSHVLTMDPGIPYRPPAPKENDDLLENRSIMASHHDENGE